LVLLSVNKYITKYVVHLKPTGLAQSAALTNTTPSVIAKQRVVKILGDQSDEWIDGYGGK